MAAGSPFFSSLPLRDHGLEWIHPSAPLAHPLDDGTAVMLERDLGAAEAALGEDGKQWRRLIGPFAEHWAELAPEVLRPVHLFTRHPSPAGAFGPGRISLRHCDRPNIGFAAQEPRHSSPDWQHIPFLPSTNR